MGLEPNLMLSAYFFAALLRYLNFDTSKSLESVEKFTEHFYND